MKAIVLTFYFGKLPNYLDVWLKGVEGNPDYDFLFLTNDKTKYNYPSNMEVRYCTFDEVRKRVQSNFDFTISLEKPYKFTEFKPAFGMIFEEEFKGYDFWGYIDQDVLLGKVSHFITEDVLKENDRILTRDHFSLYRNTDEVNKRFMTESSKYGKLYKQAFESPQIYCFGERGNYGIYHIWKENNWTIYDQPITADISYKHHYFRLTDTQGFENTQSEKQVFIMECNNGDSSLKQYSVNNKTVYEKEFLYMHLQKRAMHVTRKNMDARSTSFVIGPDTITQLKDLAPKEISEKFVEKYVGKINPIKNYIRYFNRGKIKFTKYIKQLKYKTKES